MSVRGGEQGPICLNTAMEIMQHTINRPILLTGVGLHTGEQSEMVILPAREGYGISFTRLDWVDYCEIPAAVEYVCRGSLSTSLGLRYGAKVHTVEHVLAALYGCGVDNAIIEVRGPEVPALDGSCFPIVQALQMVGLKKQDLPRQYIRIREKIALENISIEPFDGFRVDYGIKYDDNVVGYQQYYMDVTPDRFVEEISRARTFGYIEDLDNLKRLGLSKGVSESNVIALSRKSNTVLNGPLRYRDEFARHKILDLVGDFALARRPILGYVRAWKTGHRDHHKLLRKIFQTGKYAYTFAH